MEEDFTHRKNHLLLVAIDQYEHCNKLHTAVSDAKAFRDTLLENYDFDMERVYELYDKEATLPNMHKQLQSLLNKLTDDDSLIVYYAGHGDYDQARDLGYWVPVEAHPENPWEFFSNDDLSRYFQNLKTHHLLVFSDSCFSGSLFSGTRETSYNDRKDSIPSRWAFCSGMNEVVVDDSGGMSPFAKHLIHELKYSEGDMRIASLIDRVSIEVAEDAAQTPSGGPVRTWGDSQGQFIFRPKKNEPKDWKFAQENPTVEVLDKFLAKYPEGQYRDEAQRLKSSVEDDLAWEKAQSINTAYSYDDYLDSFPEGRHVDEAYELMDEVTVEKAWEKARKLNTITAYRHFEANFPSSKYADEARSMRQALKENQHKGKGENNPPKREEPKKQATANKQKPAESLKPQQAAPEAEKEKGNKKIIWIAIPLILVAIGIGVVAKCSFSETSNRNSEPGGFIDNIGGVALTMKKVEGGSFTMGCTPDQTPCKENERPAHKVILDTYYMAETEVTQELYETIVGNNPSRFNNCKQCPVENVSWHDAKVFIKKLNEKSEYTYRLPTEAEWEYAARGGVRAIRTKYAGSNNIDEVAWYGNAKANRTYPVGRKRPNELGLYDMSGNALEWCQDLYYRAYYSREPVRNPQGASRADLGDSAEPVKEQRIIRGGSWDYAPSASRISNRGGVAPDPPDNGNIGFRLACSR